MIDRRKNQEARILELLIRAGRFWVSAVELSKISLQYGRAIHSLRRLGCTIENRIEFGADGTRRGFFRLVRGVPAEVAPTPKPAADGALFDAQELERCAPTTRYPD